jgi:hypothetical protein
MTSHEAFQDVAAGFGLQIQRNRPLVGALGQVTRAHPAPIELAIGSAVAGLIGLVGVLDLDYLGAQHGQLICCERPGQNMGRIDDADALERSCHALAPVARLAPQPLIVI